MSNNAYLVHIISYVILSICWASYHDHSASLSIHVCRGLPSLHFSLFSSWTEQMVCKILRIEASFGCRFIIMHYRSLPYAVYLHYPACCMDLHGAKHCKGTAQLVRASKVWFPRLGIRGRICTGRDRSNCHALLEEMRVVHLLANFYTQAMKSIEKVSQDFQCFNWVHLNARHCHLEFGCVACKFPLIIAEVDQTYIRTYVIICACSFSFSTQKERFSAMFFVASSTFMDVDVTWHMMSAWQTRQTEGWMWWHVYYITII